MRSKIPSAHESRSIDLDLIVRREKDEYVATLLASSTQLTNQWPLSLNYLAELAHSWLGITREHEAKFNLERVKEFGGELLQAIFSGPAWDIYQRSIYQAEQEDRTLRIRLGLADAVELLELPFEYLYDKSRDRFLFLSDKFSLIRYFPSPKFVRRLTIVPPLRVLIVFSAPDELPRLNVERESETLTHAFTHLIERGLMELEKLVSPSLNGLMNRLHQQPYDALHFVGHFETSDDQNQTAMILHNDDQGIHRVSAETLGLVLRDSSNLRLAILEAGEQYRPNPSSLPRFAYKLLQSGIPSVVTTQFPLRDAQNITFIHEFYSALLNNFSLDTAITRARRGIAIREPDLSWGALSLYSSSPDGYVFDLQPIAEVEPHPPPVVVLKTGAKGAEVEALQTNLKKLGFNPGRVNGKFGRSTRTAVMAFQKKMGLIVDGVAGFRTINELQKHVEEVGTQVEKPVKIPGTSSVKRKEPLVDHQPSFKQLDSGTVLNGRYEIVRRIGGGGMGAVYLAKDRNLGDAPRAVKEMVESHLDPTQHEKAIGDFKRESLLLTALEHPSIPTIYDYFYDDALSRFYLVMKYISGGDLASRMHAAVGGRIDEKTVTDWGMQVADVLDYLHSRPKPIIYRDLKPANLMIDGNTGRVMLIDFGIARWVTQQAKGVTAVGTMGYAPPELFSGRVQPASDIYSLGATMFHLLTGSDPQDNPLLIFDFSKNPRPRQISPSISSEMEHILIKALEYRPEDRFLSAGDMRDVLATHLERLTVDSAASRMRNAFALIIGIDDYVEPGLRLRFTVRDAHRLGEVLVDPTFCGYPTENVRMLLNRDATFSAIMEALFDLNERAGPESTLLFYFGGHGSAFPASGDQELGLIPVDFSNSTRTPIIAGSALTKWLHSLKTRSTLVVLDCSHAGLLNAGPTWAVMGSADEKEMAYESEQSSFTRRLVEGLMGEVASSDGLIRVFDLYEYVRRSVTLDFPNQHPVLKADFGNNFPIALRAGEKVYASKVDEEPLARLSPEAEAAFLWAEGFRREKGTPELYSEYLLAALYFQDDGPTRRLLTAFDDPDTIETQLISFANQMSSMQVEPDKVSPASPESLITLPLSPALKKSLERAVALLSKRQKSVHPDQYAPITHKWLLAGLLTETSNQTSVWISRILRVPRETLVQIIDEMGDGELALKRIWRASRRWLPFLKLTGHESSVTAVAFSLDGGLLFSGDDEGRLRVWDVETLVGKWEGHQTRRMRPQASVQSIICGPGQVIVGWRDGYVSVFNQRLDGLIHSTRTDTPMSGSNGGLTAMAIMPDGRVILGHQNGTLSIWMAGMQDQLQTLHGHSEAVTDVAITPDGHRAVSVSLDRSLRIWHLESTTTPHTTNIGNRLTKVVLTPDGRRAISGAENGTVAVWNFDSEHLQYFQEAHTSPVTAMKITADGRSLVTTSTGGTLRLWDLESRKELPGRDDTVTLPYNALAVAPDGRTLVTGTGDGIVRLWDQARLISARPETRPSGFYRMLIRASSKTVAVGQTLVLEVRVVADQAGKGTFELLDDLAVLSCFISINDNGLRISGSEATNIRRDAQTGQFMPITFELRAYLRGTHSYSIQLFAEDAASGKINIYEATEPITIAPPQKGETRPPMLPSLDVRVAPQPDFVLQVETELPENRNGPRDLIYRLSSRLPDLRLSNQEVGRASLKAGELGQLRTLLLSTLRSCDGVQPEDGRERLLAFGVYLFDRLFPLDQAAAFHEAYWKAANHLTTWLFVEDGVTWIPWELLVPHRGENNLPLRFLGESFQLSRWIELGPALYGEVPLGEIALAHYNAPELERGDEDLSAWKRLLNAPASSGITEVVRQETPFYRLHLLRYAKDQEPREIVARGHENTTLSSDEDARRARLDLRLKRPVVSLSILDAGGLKAELARDWPLPDRVMPFLRAGASAVVGPWWPTSEAADRIFWLTFNDLLERRISLGEAVWRSRLAVERSLPHRSDWLAYTLFGDARARGYEPELSEGYTTLERLYSDQPLCPGETCYFRASISKRPSFLHQDRLVHADELPKKPMALFLAPGVQETIPEPVEMKPVGRNTVEALYDITVKDPGDFLLIARLYDGEERLQSLQLPVVVNKA